MNQLEETLAGNTDPDVREILGICEESLSESARCVVYGNLRKWIACHGEDTVRTKRSFFLKHLTVLGVDYRTEA
ncbi:MAG: hypothetical protein AB7D51_14630 [Desulfovibrionaceae bacterium]